MNIFDIEFIDTHGDTPQKISRPIDLYEQEDVHKFTDEVDSAFRFVREPKIRPPKPRRVHLFEPKIRGKKRFEKLFEKQVDDESKNALLQGKFIHLNLNFL